MICDAAVCTVPLQHFCDSVTLIPACIIIIIIIIIIMDNKILYNILHYTDMNYTKYVRQIHKMTYWYL